MEERKVKLEEVKSSVLNGSVPKLRYELPEGLSPDFVISLFKMIWMSQLYSVYKSRMIARNEIERNMQSMVRALKNKIRDSIMSDHDFYPEICNVRILLLKAYWNYRGTDKKFKKDMKELMRIKLSLETEIYTGKEIKEFSVNPRHLKTAQFNEWYEGIESRYKEYNKFTEIKEDELYDWEVPETNFLSSIFNVFSVTFTIILRKPPSKNLKTNLKINANRFHHYHSHLI